MNYKDYKKIEEMQQKCKKCIWLVNNGNVYYCPFAGCIEKSKKPT